MRPNFGTVNGENSPQCGPVPPPGDIVGLPLLCGGGRVVAGMGDSITAGFALNNLPEESRNKSYCCGAGKGELTISNFLNDLNSENGGEKV